MRKILIVVAAFAVAILGMRASPAFAQAPSPQVTITGIVDNVANFNRNQGLNFADRVRGSLAHSNDQEIYERLRGRFDLVGALGKAKAVWGLELDALLGQTGTFDQCTTLSNGAPLTQQGCRPDGTSVGFDADTDSRNLIETKWLYTEFPLTGPGSLMPWIPYAGTFAIGGQPYRVMLKPALFAYSDFPGVWADMVFSPTLRGELTYVQFENRVIGNTRNNNVAGFGRGNDWGIIADLDVKPFKGLQIKPIFAYRELEGTSSLNVRVPTGGYGVGAANFAPDGSVAVAGTAGGPLAATFTNIACIGGLDPNGNQRNCRSQEERDYWVGFDTMWQAGPFYFAPTAFYQWGTRERIPGATDPGRVNAQREADISAWIVDLQGGWRNGPLNLEARAMATSGNKASDNLNDKIYTYSDFMSGNAYWIGWDEAGGIGNIDYLTSLNGFQNSLSQPRNIGYDRYGRFQFSLRARYALTPAFSVYGIVSPQWTTEKVDTDQIITGVGLAQQQGGVIKPCDRTCQGDHRYLGTGLTGGLTWSFAPGLVFDAVYGYFVTGEAYQITVDNGTFAGGAATGTFTKHDPKDTQVASFRVRYSF